MFPLVAALLLQAGAVRPQPPPSFETLSRQAEAARDAHRLDEALSLYRKALKLRPRWEEGLWGAGSIEYDQDKYEECAVDFKRLAALKPDQSPPWTMAGLCEYHLRRYDIALANLLRAQQAGFQEGTELARAGQLHLALVLIKLRNFEKAIGTLISLTRNEKQTQETVVAAGIAGLRKPWTPPEVPEAERAKVFQVGEAMTAVIKGDTKTAIEKFDAVLRLYPAEPNIHFRYGAFLMHVDADRGIQEINKTLELEPEHIPALVGLASIYLRRDQPSSAREYAERAVKLAPDDFATHVTLGRVLRDTDDTAGALRQFETAVRLAPASPEAHYNLATVYSKLDRKEDATREREAFRRLRKMTDPNLP